MSTIDLSALGRKVESKCIKTATVLLMRNQTGWDFSVLIMSGAYASSAALTIDILSAACTLAGRLGLPTPRWRAFSATTPVLLGNGMSINVRSLPKHLGDDRSTWILPGLGVHDLENLGKRFKEPDALAAICSLQAHARRGGRIAASCSAVFLLQAADLLVGRRVTTSWWLAPSLKRLEPRCTVEADRMVISDGAITTAGAAMAQIDLMLHLVRQQCGPKLADAIARILLIDGRQAQSPFVLPTLMVDGNHLVGALVARIESSLPDPPTVGELAAEFCMSKRTLSRHVQSATGRSTLALVQGVRLRRARLLLENSRLTVDQIAEQVGYSDATAFRRMLRKFAGGTPSKFRASACER
jgi:transcriptional regulator GlxA family with amidase domain